MSASDESGTAPAVETTQTDSQQGLRVNGKNWKEPKAAFRMNKGMTSFEKRMEERKNTQAAKAKIQEMRDEKETIRQVCSHSLFLE
jgi:rRNA-processing protein CGR1